MKRRRVTNRGIIVNKKQITNKQLNEGEKHWIKKVSNKVSNKERTKNGEEA